MRSEADVKAEMKKAMIELRSLGVELTNALDRAAQNIEAKEGFMLPSLREVYQRVTARSEEILRQLDQFQDELINSRK